MPASVSSASGGAFCDAVAVRAQAGLLGRASDKGPHPAGSLAYANRRRLYRPTIAFVQAQLTCRRSGGACREEVDSARGASRELGWYHGVEQTVALRATAVGTQSTMVLADFSAPLSLHGPRYQLLGSVSTRRKQGEPAALDSDHVNTTHGKAQ